MRLQHLGSVNNAIVMADIDDGLKVANKYSDVFDQENIIPYNSYVDLVPSELVALSSSFGDIYSLENNSFISKTSNGILSVTQKELEFNASKASLTAMSQVVDVLNIGDESTTVTYDIINNSLKNSERAELTVGYKEFYNLTDTKKVLKITIDGGSEQTITCNTGTHRAYVVAKEINKTSSGFYASVDYNDFLVLSSISKGSSSSVAIGSGDINDELGISNGDSEVGIGSGTPFLNISKTSGSVTKTSVDSFLVSLNTTEVASMDIGQYFAEIFIVAPGTVGNRFHKINITLNLSA